MLQRLYARQGSVLQGVADHVAIDVDQFYGIEIEEFPAQIAQVALWLMDHQMNLRVAEQFGEYFARLPLTKSPTIVHGNALRIDWKDVVKPEALSYILGNPPFVGKKEQNAAQKADMANVFAGVKSAGVLDFVAAWYLLAAKYVQGTTTRCAFVSTNSITQGEQVGVLWSELYRLGMHIQFAHRTFKWSNEARGRAAVHCVVIGFSTQTSANHQLFDYEQVDGEPHLVIASKINPYLVDASEIFLSKRSTPILPIPEIAFGSMPNDGGHLLLSEREKTALLDVEPNAGRWIRPFLGSEEFINGIARWCLWLTEISPNELRRLPHISARVAEVRAVRADSPRATTNALAATPTIFGEIRQPTARYIAIPKTSSENRTFIPIGFLDPNVVASTELFTVSGGTLFDFGILTSTMQMAWLRSVCGRLKSDFRYSAGIVYNNFPWPESPDDKHSAAIETTAQAVLDARAGFPDSTLADLYDPLSMPPALVKAHQTLDRAVDAAYLAAEKAAGRKAPRLGTDAERVAFLFERYQQLTSLLPAGKARPKSPRRVARASRPIKDADARGSDG